MEAIAVKSQAGNRIRLKWELFQSTTNIELIASRFEGLFIDFRSNAKCSSIIFTHQKNTSLDEIIASLYELFEVKLKQIELSLPAANVICGSNKSCSRCEIKEVSKISWRTKLIEFGVLSGYALYIFIKETVLGVALATSPFSLTAIVALVAAIPLLKESLDDIQEGKFTLQTFMGGTLILAVFFGEVTAAFEIIYILRGGMLLEEYIATRSKDEIHKLVELDIQKVYVLQDDVEIEMDIEDIQLGDIVVSRSGEKIPVDGYIQKGSAEINEAVINGRSEPEFKQSGDEVFAGTICEKGRIYTKVTGVGNSTYISRTMKEVEANLALKSNSELEADKLASRLLKLGSVLTVGTFVLTGSFINAFAVMIVMSCPCATVLAASTAISAGISNGAKNGILIKGGDALESVSRAEVFCFDKTGTLTTGKPIVTDILLSEGIKKEELIEYAAIAEYRNSHPIARSIVAYAQEHKIEIDQCTLSEVIPGFGVKAKIDDETILVGNKSLFSKYKISTKEYKSQIAAFLNDGKTVVLVAKEKKLLGVMAFTHEVRPKTREMIQSLRKQGVKHIVLLTGDEEKVASSFASSFSESKEEGNSGFDEVYANQTPHGKAQVIEELKKNYNNVVMVGDGVNDTFAMSKADVAISFAAGGSEAAIAVSDIAITHSHPEDVSYLYTLSKKSLEVVNQNYWLGTGTNLTGVAFASVGLLSPVAAGAIHIGHTVGIMANSSRLAYSS